VKKVQIEIISLFPSLDNLCFYNCAVQLRNKAIKVMMIQFKGEHSVWLNGFSKVGFTISERQN